MANKTQRAITLGDKVKDAVSGFTGIVTGYFSYLNGCVRLNVEPDKLSKDGALKEARIFDIEQLILLQSGKLAIGTPSGGPRDNPQQRATPTR